VGDSWSTASLGLLSWSKWPACSPWWPDDRASWRWVHPLSTQQVF
jgi:hypothetical protein